MKRILGFALALLIAATSFAAGNSVVLPASKAAKVKASEVFIPIGKSGEKVSLLDLSVMKVKEVEALTGEKMNLADKVGFTLAQKKLRNSINADGTFNNKKLDKLASKADAGSGFHLGGFALGFLLGLIGVLIAYLIKDDKKAARVKWAWIGLAIWVVLWLLLFVAL